MSDSWLRVSVRTPCPRCGKADWCCVSKDGKFACCMRIEEGAYRTDKHPDGLLRNGGWLHRLDGRLPAPRAEIPRPGPLLNFTTIVAQGEKALTDTAATLAAEALGVPAWTLRALHCGRFAGILGFPMSNPAGAFIGVRLRTGDGRKLCIKGSKNGLFLAPPNEESPLCFIVEGGTNLLALLGIGLWGVGRPSCTAGLEMLEGYLADFAGEIVILRDNDPPESALYSEPGAARLLEALAARGKAVKIATTLTKDLRDWVRAGAGVEAVMGLVRAARFYKRVPVWNPKICTCRQEKTPVEL